MDSTWNKSKEKMEHDLKILITLKSKRDKIAQALQLPTFYEQPSSRKVDMHLKKDFLLCPNSYYMHPNDKSKTINLQAHNKHKKLEYSVGQKDDEMKICKILLHKLMNHKDAWVFNEVVDTVKLGIPNYRSIIKHPMDLGTINKNLENGYYYNPEEFAYDVRLTFLNAMTFNPVGHYVYKMAHTLSKLFEQQWSTKSTKYPLYKETKINKPTPVLHTKVNFE
jgi:hypothetical protein